MKKSAFKRKFLVSGNTDQYCEDLCKKEFREWNKKGSYEKADKHPDCPCYIPNPNYSQYKYGIYNITSKFIRDLDRCRFPDKYGKPKTYVVALTNKDKWVCNCPFGIFKKVNGESKCTHVYEVRCNPSRYEISVVTTATAIDVADAL